MSNKKVAGCLSLAVAMPMMWTVTLYILWKIDAPAWVWALYIVAIPFSVVVNLTLRGDE